MPADSRFDLEGRALERDRYPGNLVGTAMFLSPAASDFIAGPTIDVDGGKPMH